MGKLEDSRKSYEKDSLTRDELSSDPIIQFERWYQEAEKVGIEEPNAMTLATSNREGKPSARIVLLKGFGPKGFVFYTNYASSKGQDLVQNPQAAAVFWWKEMERQIRIEGEVVKTKLDTSRGYFHSRPRGSQISAWASPQSQEIKEHYLSEKRAEVESRFSEVDPIPLPHYWGGFLLKPSTIEFWQGRKNRYHDRYKFRLSDDGTWSLARLAP